MNRLSWTIVVLTIAAASAFTHTSNPIRTPLKLNAQNRSRVKHLRNEIAAALVASSLVLTPLPSSLANAYEDSDYASDTVKQTVKDLQDAGTKSGEVLKVYENIAAIITEGKGVGGNVNYQGVQLNRGYVADEDTSIYNPGLTLLTESEKERMVEAIINARKAGLTAQSWSEDNEIGFNFLKEKLDPLHMTELKGYLGILPFYGAFLYLVTLGIQQFSRNIFQYAYVIAAALVFAPVVALIAAGP
mmetsp:Transcript_8512/g.12324  ORF Transcript_8512/g.12324 Transcript_8512/m.12324 type:complete len:245 (+) Transcript_8512:72-806(+)